MRFGLREILASTVITLLWIYPMEGAQAQQFVSSGTLQIGGTVDPVTLDPHVATSVDITLLRNVYEPLVDVDPKTLAVSGVLAESWQVTADARTFTFKIRQGVRFSDGAVLDANAVKRSLDRLKTINKGTAWIVDAVSEVSVVDRYTVRVRLGRNFPFLRSLPLVYIVSPTAIESHQRDGDLAQGWFQEKSAGTGPYVIESWTHGQSVSYVRNETYWRGWRGSHFQRVVVRAPLDQSVQRLMLERGDLDAITNFSFDDLPALQANPAISIFKSGSQQQLYLRMNYQFGPTKDKRVRQAIATVWDPKAWEAVARNTEPSDGPTPLELLGQGYRPQLGMRFDLEAAKRLITEAGYPQGFTLNYLWDEGNTYKLIFGELLQGQLAKIGVRMNIQVLSPAAFFARVGRIRQDGENPNTIHLFLLRAIPRIPDPYSFLYFLYYSNAQEGFGRNYMLYRNVQVDGLIDRAVAEPDPTRALTLYRQANDLVIQDLPDVFVEKTVFVLPMRKTLQGFVFRSVDQLWPLRFYDLSRKR